MIAYAHVLVEHGGRRFEPGDELPAALPGLDELVAAGSASHSKPTRNLVTDSEGNVLEEVHADGTVEKRLTIDRFDGDFSDAEIADPDVDTPLLGSHANEAQHRAQEPHVYSDADDAGRADA